MYPSAGRTSIRRCSSQTPGSSNCKSLQGDRPMRNGKRPLRKVEPACLPVRSVNWTIDFAQRSGAAAPKARKTFTVSTESWRDRIIRPANLTTEARRTQSLFSVAFSVLLSWKLFAACEEISKSLPPRSFHPLSPILQPRLRLCRAVSFAPLWLNWLYLVLTPRTRVSFGEQR